MKRFLPFVLLLFCAAMVSAQDAGTALDYGARVNIGPGIETSLDLSYHQAPNTYGPPAVSKVTCIHSPVWTLGGDRIFFTDGGNIFSVPVTGGIPRLEFESNYIYSYNGRKFILQEHIRSLVGVSPDGKSLYFTCSRIGEGSGAQITLTDNIDKDGSWNCGASGGTLTLERLDLTTGTAAVVVENALFGTLSRSGKYLQYVEVVAKSSRVLDLVSGKEWDLPLSTFWYSFSRDEQSLVYSMVKDNTPQFFRIPFQGGEPQQLASPLDTSGNPCYMDCSPDGEWAAYTLSTGESYSNSGTSASGIGWRFNKEVKRLCLSNLTTGQIIDLIPFSKSIDGEMARFSPDGKQICYVRRDMENPDDEWALYLKDISLPVTESGGQVAVTDRAPKGFALTGNYPNPFNPSTHIAFTLPSSGAAQVTVYDVTGRTVRNLVSSTLSAGAHEMVWDGRDDSGARVSSGTYIARLKMGNLTASHRMMLMK